ncbi:12961_t:CDS:2 [Ambispora gerdemannii]|uniref:12961_t:CDS:1 n=1 Tax=Ambispora gerdemannii TaxID=144530 RepID=A0A9N9BHT9_9GLOM|nr:12961_t:CDS:2 [Ambispora gerdemannii]
MSNLVPDILCQIFENIIGIYSFTFGPPKYKFLYPCIFVNRIWCRTAIPILYREPFIRRNENGYKLVSTFLAFINDEKRALLYENDQHDIVFCGSMQFQRPLFDYSSYMCNLHYDAMLKNIDEWCQERILKATLPSEKQRKIISSPKNIFSHIFQKQSKSKSESIENMDIEKSFHELQCAIVDALLTLFMENLVRLSKLRVCFRLNNRENYEKNMLLVQNIKYYPLLSMVREIYLTVELHVHNEFLTSLAKCCQSLELILIEFGIYIATNRQLNHWNNITDKTGESISILIQAQKKLCSITTIGMTNPCSNQLISSLASQSSSLKRAEFLWTDFSGSTPWYGLASCAKLNTLTITHCQSIDDEMAQPLFDAKFECLNDVTITSNSCVKLGEWAQKFNKS